MARPKNNPEHRSTVDLEPAVRSPTGPALPKKWHPWCYPADFNDEDKISRGEWLASRSPGELLFNLFGYYGPVTLRDLQRCVLFELACCRRGWSLIENDPVRLLVEAIDAEVETGRGRKRVEALRARLEEGFAGKLPRKYLVREDELIEESGKRPPTPPIDNMRSFVLSIHFKPRADFDGHYLRAALALGGRRFQDELAAQAAIVRDIFGDPYRQVKLDPAWRTSTVVALARHMYESRDFSAMPILADALQDAGCDCDDILDHCRGDSFAHVRGCWVVDRVLGPEDPGLACRPLGR